jgi:hypothetical protein
MLWLRGLPSRRSHRSAPRTQARLYRRRLRPPTGQRFPKWEANAQPRGDRASVRVSHNRAMAFAPVSAIFPGHPATCWCGQRRQQGRDQTGGRLYARRNGETPPNSISEKARCGKVGRRGSASYAVHFLGRSMYTSVLGAPTWYIWQLPFCWGRSSVEMLIGIRQLSGSGVAGDKGGAEGARRACGPSARKYPLYGGRKRSPYIRRLPPSAWLV